MQLSAKGFHNYESTGACSSARAAQRLGITQSAASNALSRLRMAFADELFQRTPGGMEPTALARDLAAPIRAALDAVREAVELNRPFDPASARDEFVVGVSDYAEFVLGPAATAEWRTLDLVAHAVVARVGAGPAREGKGANVLGDPRVALAWLANELSGLGLTLRKDQVITTGTCMIPLEISRGDHVRADFGVLGTVEVYFV